MNPLDLTTTLTKREYIIVQCLAALMANPNTGMYVADVANQAIAQADALLSALNETDWNEEVNKLDSPESFNTFLTLHRESLTLATNDSSFEVKRKKSLWAHLTGTAKNKKVIYKRSAGMFISAEQAGI